jgi:hypothetical protein
MNVAAEWAAFLLSILEIPSSNISQEVSYKNSVVFLSLSRKVSVNAFDQTRPLFTHSKEAIQKFKVLNLK